MNSGRDSGPSGSIVAAQALAEGAVLVTTDKALHALEGLEVRHWNEIDPDRLAGIGGA
jgi:hypothetical protein